MEENFDLNYKFLFRKYYANLLFYATRIVGEEEAEDVVQDVFVELWNRKDAVTVGDQIQAFLYRAVYTRALNVLKHRDVKNSYEAVVLDIHKKRIEYYQPDSNDVVKRIEDRELRRELSEAINELPEKCKMVFKLSYLHDMKNKDIAETMGISLRTVEAHMYKALKFLRDRLGYLNLLWALFFLGKVSVFMGSVVLLLR
nr:RNA polymerase sigma-70 factor [uncultured Bacteroides sp.]